LYLQSREDLKSWDFQSPPNGVVPAPTMNAVAANGESINGLALKLPRFGPYEKQRRKMIREQLQKANVLVPPPTPSAPVQTTVPTVQAQIGRALSRIGKYNSLNNKVSLC
jgi:hypothetical protein